ncbi:MAG: alpha/beta hydrolase [Lachnospiraceae bacterium]|nr:alpha/beta hydrolase [Lachnospiraceae bacterium]
MSITSYLVRKAFGNNDKKRDAGLTTPDTIKRFDDIPYGADRKWQLLDVYRPIDQEGPLPVIINVHGGGMVYGSKEAYQYYCMSLAEHGFAVVNFNYRLAPEFKFPAALEDTALVFDWVLNNSFAYGFDVCNIFAFGDSAGANLLGLYCCIYSNPDYAKTFSFEVPFCPKAVVLNCGIYHRTYTGKKNLDALLMANLMPHKGTPEEYRLLSVDECVTKDFPPAFIMTGEGDFLADQALPFYEKLKSLCVAAEYHYYGDAEHVLGHVFQCNIRLPEAIECTREECAFLRRFISHHS